MQFKHFHDSLNIVVILAPDRKFFFVKCAQLPLTFAVKLNEGHFSFRTAIIHF